MKRLFVIVVMNLVILTACGPQESACEGTCDATASVAQAMCPVNQDCEPSEDPTPRPFGGSWPSTVEMAFQGGSSYFYFTTIQASDTAAGVTFAPLCQDWYTGGDPGSVTATISETGVATWTGRLTCIHRTSACPDGAIVFTSSEAYVFGTTYNKMRLTLYGTLYACGTQTPVTAVHVSQR